MTARLRIGDLPEVRQWPEVLSVKSGRRTRPQLDAAVPDVNAQLNMLPANIEGNQGEGVVIGIIDSGGDFTHQNFRRADGATRIEAIWDQRIEQPSNSPFGYGRVYSEAELNAALKAFDNAPAVQYYGNLAFERPSHGTHVMDIAGGNGQGTGAPGVAPNATLVFVHAAPADIRFLGPSVVGSDFGDSIRLAEAVRFILDQAGDRPCVINISLGTNGGPHDGSNPVEESIDAMLSQAPNRAVVISAGNAFADGIHTSGQVSQTRSVDLSWEIGPFDPTHNEIEIWYPQGDEFTAQLILPDGRALQPVGLGTNGRIRDDDGNVLIFIAHRENDPNNGDNVIGLYMEAGLPSGTWTVRLQGVRVQNGEFHAWIERDDPGQSSFSPLQHDNRFTLGSLACGHKSIVVGSYDAREPSKPLSVFSSSGPTRDGRQKPEVSAPGHGVKAAYSKTISGNASMSGTSMAAPDGDRYRRPDASRGQVTRPRLEH